MVSPARRTWMLGTLDRDVPWRLWFDPVARRWEVEPIAAWSSTSTDEPPAWDDDQLEPESPSRLRLL